MACEARITELENEASTLRRQVSELKEVLAVELECMRTEIQTQLSEARQLLLSRESASMERVAHLETEVANLTHFCEQAMRKEDVLACFSRKESVAGGFKAADGVTSRPSRERESVPSQEGDNTSPYKKILSAHQGTAVKLLAIHEVSCSGSAIDDLHASLGEVYDFYTATSALNADVLHPAMHLSHFTSMVRDAGLCGGRHPVPPELLWMAVMRSLSVTAATDTVARRASSTLLLPRVYGDESYSGKKDLFARERLQCIPRAQFSDALYIVYFTAFPRTRDSTSSPAHFRDFLVNTFLPNVKRRIHHRVSKRSPYVSPERASRKSTAFPSSLEASVAQIAPLTKFSSVTTTIPPADVVAAYEGDAAVRKLVQQFTPHLKKAFLEVVQPPPHLRLGEVHMSLEAFMECVRQHKLLPLVSKMQVKAVFVFCLNAQLGPPSSKVGERIVYASFVTAMHCLAELIYGSEPTLQRRYPSPRARLSKLFVKMFVL
ncbi:hypothetical protein ABL78_6985 [Leptomonas seymouri]|uniref:Uncharacterized protein n=1 Tax=Leptomonas seymouri TaxID=5684 RepID=A0A0N1HUL5_LEPSE|nr:hypothetical protein ABL78_6985 [Leptomonas seymouri]|eukprot:KPI83974.1 hypothetical protein ABL78_6985 [Leptomonas seymouri]